MAESSAETSLLRRPIEELRFVVVGAYVMDCFITTSHLPEWGRTHEARSIRTSPGGKALNQAVALARLGAQVTAVGVVGDDAVGRDVLAALEREQVDINWMETREGVATTVCACFVGDEGESAIVWHVDDDVAVRPENVRAAGATFERADAALVTFEMPLSTIRETINIAHRRAARVFVQPAPPLAKHNDVGLVPWHQVDVLVPNEEEAQALLSGGDDASADDLAGMLSHDLAVPMVVITLGESGCVEHAAGVTHRYAVDTSVAVDTTGAGDAFMASLAACLVAGAPNSEAIHAAQSNAASAIQVTGGHDSMPSPNLCGKLITR
jgi:ribokinase